MTQADRRECKCGKWAATVLKEGESCPFNCWCHTPKSYGHQNTSEGYKSHYHCWEQGDTPACGSKAHARCCLCPVAAPTSEIEERLVEEFESKFPYDVLVLRDLEDWEAPIGKGRKIEAQGLKDVKAWLLEAFAKVRLAERDRVKKILEGMEVKYGWMPLGYKDDPYNKTLNKVLSALSPEVKE